MSKKDEALKLALEALEHMCMHTRAKVGYRNKLIGEAMDKAREALAEPDDPLTAAKRKLAEQPAQLDPSVGTQVSKVWWDGDKLMAQLIPLEQFYKEPEKPAQQDPCPGCRKGVVCRTPKCGRLKLPVDHPFRAEQPAQQQEPVAWIVEDKYGERLEWAADADMGWGNKTEPLYTSPPASKPWVGLTSKEREELDAEAWHFGPEAQYGMRVSEMTEAKLREKNA